MKQIFALTIASIFMLACQKIELPENTNEPDFSDIFTIEAPEDFNYATTKKVSLTISAVNNEGNELVNVPVKIYIPDNDAVAEEGEEEAGGKLVSNGFITSSGSYTKELILDKNIENILVYTPYLGLPAYHRINISSLGDQQIQYVMGEDNTTGFTGNPGDHEWTTGLAGESGRNNDQYEHDGNFMVGDRNLSFTYMGGYNNMGVPNYLESQDDDVPQSILTTINSSLPESQPVPSNNPQYIADDVSANTELVSAADVWITFVHEGAGYKNALGFYTYPTNNPPTSPDQITNFQIVYPNVSFLGSGGGLNTGNKVYLGQFPANTSIGYFLIPDGWKATPQIVEEDQTGNPAKYTKYSDKDFNTFTDAAYRSHNVLLNDPVNQILLLGFEDISRPGGDNDFNDAIFYVTANPFTAINTSKLAQSQTGGDDTDGDGIPDSNDQFSGDPNVAFVGYAPAQNQYGTLAFEDLWPNQGDYDLNDMVIDYNFAEMRNASNNVVRIQANFILRAMGAGLRNGFAFELPIDPSNVLSVTGNNLSVGYTNTAANGTEEGQANTVITVFENGYDLIGGAGGGFMNTEDNAPFVNPVNITVEVQFASPINPSLLGGAPYNPFIIAGGNREKEVHLPDHAPTNLANTSYFGTESDDSSVSTGKFYKTATNLPWAIHMTESFEYPKEKKQITQAYNFFAQWAITGGTSFTDWYLPNAGYRQEAEIY